MQNGFLTGLFLGLVSAALFASAVTGPALAQLFLMLAVPLPIFLAGLGWGWPAAGIAGLAGTILATLWAGPSVGIGFFAVECLPATILCYLALLSRNAHAPDGTAVREWYPAGSLLMWASLLAGALAAVSMLMLGGDIEGVKASIRTALEKAMSSTAAGNPGQPPVSAEELDKITAAIMQILPAATALGWLLSLAGNLWLAGRIVLASGMLSRPWPDLPAIDFPRGTGLALAAALGGTLAQGQPGMVAGCFAGGLLAAYVLMGLAILHYVSRGRPWRPFALWALYIALLLVNAGLAAVIALLGIAEPVIRLRDRVRPPPPPLAGPPA